MTLRKGEVSPRMVDRDWPHQVALPAERMMGDGHKVIREFCRELSLCQRGHTVQRDDRTYRVFCFADPSHADLFRQRFGGEPFDPKDRGRGREWHLWRIS
jgi:hypothetical protein